MDRVIFIFALLFGAGILGLLPFLNHRRIKPGFFMLVALLGFLAVFAVLAVALSMRAAANPFLVALLAGALLYGILVLTRRVEHAGTVGWMLLAAALGAAVSGGWSLGSGPTGEAIAAPIDRPLDAATLSRAPAPLSAAAAPLGAAAFIAGAGLLGSVTLALLLGHWYLYSPGLPISHLRRLTTLVAIFLVARLVIFTAVIPAFAPRALGAFGGANPFSPLSRSGFDAAALLASNVPLIAMRLLLGILIPGVLAWMIDRTVRIRSTQSATGLLYVAFIFVLFGEFISAYLCTLTGAPV